MTHRSLRLAFIPAFVTLAGVAHAWIYTDNYEDSSQFGVKFLTGGTVTTSARTESGNRFLQVTSHGASNTGGPTSMMVGIYRTIPFVSQWPYYDPSSQGSFANIQVELDGRYISSVGDITANLGILLIQGSQTFYASTPVAITSANWQHFSTGPISVGSLLSRQSGNIDLSPTGAPILVCVGLDARTGDSLSTNQVTFDIDNPTIQTDVVPEPSAFLAVLGGLSVLGRRRKISRIG
ncbi:MAG: PEP-CTERM sorting domain-containing protein [Armatimonadetes bacterium]|nr:PEP-CTERM sorting domain-containing protein [Armatimonadota bacterium]